MDNGWQLYEVTVKYPCGFIGKSVNMNFSPEAAIDVVKHGIGMENDEEYVNSCEIISVVEVVRDPNNKFNYIPKEK